MREIKFRAWNKEKSIMVYNDEDNEADYWDGAVANDVQMVNSCLNDPFDISEYLWMQFTGLLDKNGTEIYEGDILKHPNPVGEVNGVYEVEYIVESCSCSAAYMGISRTEMYDMKAVQFPLCEIIGNIHENPELLKC